MVYFFEFKANFSSIDLIFEKLVISNSVVLADTTFTWPSIPPQKRSSP